MTSVHRLGTHISYLAQDMSKKSCTILVWLFGGASGDRSTNTHSAEGYTLRQYI